MPDLITGVLVLQRMKAGENLYRLWLQYRPAGKVPAQTWILMRENGIPGPVGPAVWQFTRRNPWLDGAPSLRILGGEGQPDIFHNEGAWSNHYVEMAKPLGESSDGSAMDVHEAINWPPERTKEERDVVILKYRAEGVLL